MRINELTANEVVMSQDIKNLQERKHIVGNISYSEINQKKNCQDIKANWMLLTQTELL
ncbi:hypothetical protein KO505_05995 [Psychrosphaera sp. F3M07]|uniref:hypothetical protein n=1 Tax=Psychrosphaera sp. F3M07 TaxID=2841560 RepID=UPI001C08423D|nr:hypothetical protein [Psychrosphaera sp. F3M07]MBU2917516.1 hypothetical protein [Psychrosphaera sp. F3M07]